MIPKYRKTVDFMTGIATNPGQRYKTVYRATVLKNGRVKLTEDGKEDLWQKINAEKEHTDMAFVLKQMALGDYSAFTAEPQYIDMTKLPTSRMELLNLFMNIERDFNSLPIDVRQKFNNDFKQWYAEAEGKEWFDKMGINIEKTEVKEEVKNDAGNE